MPMSRRWTQLVDIVSRELGGEFLSTGKFLLEKQDQIEGTERFHKDPEGKNSSPGMRELTPFKTRS